VVARSIAVAAALSSAGCESITLLVPPWPEDQIAAVVTSREATLDTEVITFGKGFDDQLKLEPSTGLVLHAFTYGPDVLVPGICRAGRGGPGWSLRDRIAAWRAPLDEGAETFDLDPNPPAIDLRCAFCPRMREVKRFETTAKRVVGGFSQPSGAALFVLHTPGGGDPLRDEVSFLEVAPGGEIREIGAPLSGMDPRFAIQTLDGTIWLNGRKNLETGRSAQLWAGDPRVGLSPQPDPPEQVVGLASPRDDREDPSTIYGLFEHSLEDGGHTLRVGRLDGDAWSILGSVRLNSVTFSDRSMLAWRAPRDLLIISPRDELIFNFVDGRDVIELDELRFPQQEEPRLLSVLEIGAFLGTNEGRVFHRSDTNQWTELPATNVGIIRAFAALGGRLLIGGSSGIVLYDTVEGPCRAPIDLLDGVQAIVPTDRGVIVGLASQDRPERNASIVVLSLQEPEP
jgi:hypothetical protein